MLSSRGNSQPQMIILGAEELEVACRDNGLSSSPSEHSTSRKSAFSHSTKCSRSHPRIVRGDHLRRHYMICHEKQQRRTRDDATSCELSPEGPRRPSLRKKKPLIQQSAQQDVEQCREPSEDSLALRSLALSLSQLLEKSQNSMLDSQVRH